jgi:endoglucanase
MKIKKLTALCYLFLLFFAGMLPAQEYPEGSPVAINGPLHVDGVYMCNQYGKPTQLRGISTHGMHWFPNCVKPAAIEWLAKDWKCDILRMAVYMDEQEDGWEELPEPVTTLINTTVDECAKVGMYCIIDDHIINPGDPMLNIEPSMEFFDIMAKEHANKPHVLYEICNEPNAGATWEGIHEYADSMIKVIRKYDSANIIIIGSPGYSSLGDGGWPYFVDNPIKGNNLMYTYHFYAGSHGDGHRDVFTQASKVLPLFVTEFGIQAASGLGPIDTVSTRKWFDLCDERYISWCNWSLSDPGWESPDPGEINSSALLAAGTCGGNVWDESVLKPIGDKFIYNEIRKPDRFETGTKIVTPKNVQTIIAKSKISVKNQANAWVISGVNSKNAIIRDAAGKIIAVLQPKDNGVFILDKACVSPGLKIISVKEQNRTVTAKIMLR